MSLEDYKTIIRRLVEEAGAQGNLAVIDTSFAPNLVVHISNAPPQGHASFREIIEQFHQAFSGHSSTIHDLIAGGDTVAVRYSYTASMHHGLFGTGQPLQYECTGFFHFEQGKVTEAWLDHKSASIDLSPTVT